MGVQTLEAQEAAADDAIYDLSGRRVAKPGKGLYIVGGRKVVFQ